MVHGMVGNLVTGSVPLLDEGIIRVQGLGEPGGLDGAVVGVSVGGHQRGSDGDGLGLDGVVIGESEELGNGLGVHALGRVDGRANTGREDTLGSVAGGCRLSVGDASDKESRDGSSQRNGCEAHYRLVQTTTSNIRRDKRKRIQKKLVIW